MAYLGRGIENLSDRVVLDSLTASATASYTLQLNSVNFVPSSAESLTVSLNGVIQAPISSYTVSGSTLTFASALTSSDSIDFIIAERGITLQTPSAGSVGTSQLASTAVTTAKIADDAVTKDKVLDLMYPAFEASLAADQTISNATYTTVTATQENLDTDNAYDTSTYKFTPQVSGKYFYYSQIRFRIGGNNLNDLILRVLKNDTSTTVSNSTFFGGSSDEQVTLYASGIVDLNGSTDNIFFQGYASVSSGSPYFESAGSGNATFFGAYRIGD